MSSPALRLAPILLLLLAATGCEENDDKLLDPAGVTAPLLVDPGQKAQNEIFDTGEISDSASLPVQVTEWDVAEMLFSDGNRSVDLTFGSFCTFFSITGLVFSSGACALGVTLDPAQSGPITVDLRLNSMKVQRAEPYDLMADCPMAALTTCTPEDLDGDMVDNDGDMSGSIFDNPCLPGETVGCDDNCPLQPNMGQEDTDGNNIGDACDLDGAADNDQDGVPDSIDNCVWTANVMQEDDDPVNGIGDVCEEEADVAVDMVQFNLDLDAFFSSSVGNFLVVDFDTSRTLLMCDYVAMTCEIRTDPAAGGPSLCQSAGVIGAQAGCPAP